MKRSSWILQTSRVLVFVVFFFNVYCAVLFLAQPGVYAPAYELSGAVGAAAIRGFGILFLMWNVPYVFAMAHPLKQFISLVEACIMQGVGLVGEILLLGTVASGHLALRSSLERFIAFDAAGLAFLGVALGLTAWERNRLRGGQRLNENRQTGG